MSIHTSVASAPILRGSIGTPSSWSGSGTSVPTMSGQYTGTLNKTLTFTGDDAGTVGTTATVTVDWDDGEGNTGRFELGSDYTPGTALQLPEGLMVAWAAGTVFASETLTVSLTAARRLPSGARYVSGIPEPLDIYVANIDRVDLDGIFPTPFGDTVRISRERQFNPTLDLDYTTPTELAPLLEIETQRHDVCVGEDYDESTVFLWRGKGLLPMIGARASLFSRSGSTGTLTQYNPRTGKIESVDDTTPAPRLAAGPLGADQVVVLDTDGGITNYIARSCGQSGSSDWTTVGSATVTWDMVAPTILDQTDAGFSSAILGGCERAYIPNGTGDHIHSSDGTIAASAQPYTGSVWMRGRGVVTLSLRAGVGSPSSTLTTSQITLTETWTRYAVTADSGASDTRIDIALGVSASDEDALVYLGPAQIEQSPNATDVVITDGSTRTRADEALVFPADIPADNGTLGFWIYLPGDDGSTTLALLDAGGVSGSERFRVNYDPTGPTLSVEMATSGTDASATIADLTAAWHHIAFTWERSSTAGKVEGNLYLDGALVDTEASQDWAGGLGTSLTVGGSALKDVRYKDIRIDGKAQSAAEIARWYERMTDDAWIQQHLHLAGRKYRLPMGVGSAMRNDSNPGQYLVSMPLTQAGIFDDSTEHPR